MCEFTRIRVNLHDCCMAFARKGTDRGSRVRWERLRPVYWASDAPPNIELCKLLIVNETPFCLPKTGGRAYGARLGWEGSYLVDPASSHMLVSKIKPCMSKYKQFIL